MRRKFRYTTDCLFSSFSTGLSAGQSWQCVGFVTDVAVCLQKVWFSKFSECIQVKLLILVCILLSPSSVFAKPWYDYYWRIFISNLTDYRLAWVCSLNQVSRAYVSLNNLFWLILLVSFYEWHIYFMKHLPLSSILPRWKLHVTR